MGLNPPDGSNPVSKPLNAINDLSSNPFCTDFILKFMISVLGSINWGQTMVQFPHKVQSQIPFSWIFSSVLFLSNSFLSFTYLSALVSA